MSLFILEEVYLVAQEHAHTHDGGHEHCEYAGDAGGDAQAESDSPMLLKHNASYDMSPRMLSFDGALDLTVQEDSQASTTYDQHYLGPTLLRRSTAHDQQYLGLTLLRADTT